MKHFMIDCSFSNWKIGNYTYRYDAVTEEEALKAFYEECGKYAHVQNIYEVDEGLNIIS